mgnify:CR=1 FL=1
MYTISRDYRKEIVIEKSRFICSLKKVHSEAEAQEFIKAVKKEFWDATHNCSAYIVDDMAQRSSDDGEPSGRHSDAGGAAQKRTDGNSSRGDTLLRRH